MSLSVDLRSAPAVLVAIGLAVGLAGCSQELYGETQDSVTLPFGDAVATNRVAQMVDPWADHTADTRLTYKGRPMNAAIDRYYSGTVLPPVAIGTESGLAGATKSASAAAPATSK